MIGIGLMSGTSLDGVDAALVEIHEINGKIHYELLNFITKPFKEGIKEEIEKALSLQHSNVQLICSLNFKLGYEFAEAAKLVCNGVHFPIERVDFIASHGQTIWHQPLATDNFAPSTLQIGEAAVIAYETGCQVVSNFRVMDIAAGGQGAPLVSYPDYLLFRDGQLNVVLQNIGGIANLTYLPKGCTADDVLSFDTGPGNMMIDEVTQRYFGKPYDSEGKIARSGRVIESLLDKLMQDTYLTLQPPKSTGREHFGKQYVNKIIESLDSSVRPQDILATFTHFVAESIVYHYKKHLGPIDRVIVSGGGSYNTYLLECIQQRMNCEVITMESFKENSNAKEAIAFALLGYETLHHRTNNVKNATGAKRSVVLGHITPIPYLKEEITDG